MFVYCICIGRCDDDKEIVFNIFSAPLFSKNTGSESASTIVEARIEATTVVPEVVDETT